MKDTECLRGLMGKYTLREKWKEGRVHVERVGGIICPCRYANK